jgi:SecD/SecF fusion protein
VRLVYRAQGGAMPVTASSLTAAIEVMRARVRRLGESQASFRLAGDEIEVALSGADAADVQEAVAKTGQLDFYDWEANVIGRDGAPEPNEGTVTGDATRQGAGGFDAGLPEYQAVLRAAKRAPMLRGVDTTWSPGCTPRQSGGCLYGSWYLLDIAHEAVLRGPEDTMKSLYAGRYTPPAGARPKAVRVNPGTVLVQAHALENEAGKVIDPSPNSWYALNDDPILTSAEIIDPVQSTSEFDDQPNVTFGFTPRGKTAFEKVTKQIAARGREAVLPGVTKEEALQHFAVVLDGQLITVPSIDFTKYPEGISAADGSEIEGGFTVAEARELADEMQSGAIPIKLELVSRSVVPVLVG